MGYLAFGIYFWLVYWGSINKSSIVNKSKGYNETYYSTDNLKFHTWGGHGLSVHYEGEEIFRQSSYSSKDSGEVKSIKSALWDRKRELENSKKNKFILDTNDAM